MQLCALGTGAFAAGFGLNPFTISHTARTISCTPTGRLSTTCVLAVSGSVGFADPVTIAGPGGTFGPANSGGHCQH